MLTGKLILRGICEIYTIVSKFSVGYGNQKPHVVTLRPRTTNSLEHRNLYWYALSNLYIYVRIRLL